MREVLSFVGGALAEEFGSVCEQALARYPEDRSCYTCDFYLAGNCAHWQYKEIPLPARENGCDSWKAEDEVPF